MGVLVMKKSMIGLSLAALTLATGALAAPDGALRGNRAARTMTRADAQAHAAALFDRMDVNRDGKLDAADRAAREGQMFDRIDTDHNGSLSRAEFDAMHQRGPKGAGMAGMDHGPDDMKGKKHGRMGADRAGGHGMGKLADANGDGTVTRDEFVAGALTRFDTADADHDGTVTPAERQAAHGRMKGADWWGKPARDASPPPPGA
jgi:Ca2+-binding EF-hand superfamily protein